MPHVIHLRHTDLGFGPWRTGTPFFLQASADSSPQLDVGRPISCAMPKLDMVWPEDAEIPGRCPCVFPLWVSLSEPVSFMKGEV